MTPSDVEVPTDDLRLTGRTLRIGSSGRPVFVGMPKVGVYSPFETGVARSVPERNLWWRPRSRKTVWRLVSDDEPSGDLVMEVRSKGLPIASETLSVLPSTFTVRVEPEPTGEQGLVLLRGLGKALVHVPEDDSYVARARHDGHDGWAISASSQIRPAPVRLPLEISWPEKGHSAKTGSTVSSSAGSLPGPLRAGTPDRRANSGR